VAGMQLSTATSLNAANEGLALNKLLALPTGRFTVDEAPLFVPATTSGMLRVEEAGGQYHPASEPPQSAMVVMPSPVLSVVTSEMFRTFEPLSRKLPPLLAEV